MNNELWWFTLFLITVFFTLSIGIDMFEIIN